MKQYTVSAIVDGDFKQFVCFSSNSYHAFQSFLVEYQLNHNQEIKNISIETFH